jgi:hypothetical protein
MTAPLETKSTPLQSTARVHIAVTPTAKDQEQTVSLVIPCNHSTQELLTLLKAVSKGSRLPDEVLVVRSGLPGVTENTPRFPALSLPDQPLDEILSALISRTQVCDLVFAYPGKARNIGVEHASGSLIAFLDVKTIPEENWLETACKILETASTYGVWGSRIYQANSLLAGLVRDAIYGRKPVRTVAGTVCRREVFSATGAMIPWVPAGEDGDWIHRVNAHRLAFVLPRNANHRYYGLDNKPLSFFVRKWWRYYHYSRMLPVNNRDRWLAHVLLYLLLVFFAFNWNYKISGYILGSPLVVPHITTTVAIGGPAIYAFVRGVYLPLKRNTPFEQLLPFRFMLILLIAFILDSVKIMGLLKPVGILQSKLGR